jgi:NAD(P)-dependent dehydrogenase (short-subunit alcohol dehydrogenase family)
MSIRPSGPFLMAKSVAPLLLKNGWGRIINISANRQTINRKGFSPYGLSKAAVEAETAIWAQDLENTGVTVNALLPGGATLTGMIPESEPERVRASLLQPEVIVPPLLWLVSNAADGVTGKRIIATEWSAGERSFENAGF